MASIVENITGDKALQLGNEEFVRKMTIGNNWNYLRIGYRVIVNGTANITAPRLYAGLNNGDQNTFASSACDGWIGMGPNPTLANNWIYNVGGYYAYGQGAAAPFGLYAKKLGSTTTEAIAGAQLNHYIAAAGSGPSLLFVDILRTSSSTYTIYFRSAGVTGAATTTTTFYDLLRSMEDEAAGNYATAFMSSTPATSLSVTGMPSNLDTVSLYWNKSTPTVEISDLSIVRFY